ncbi:MAG: ParB/RepB/Spo0J family partition protein [Chitinophagales bacterium]
MSKRALGKGLEALFAIEGNNTIDSYEINIERIVANKDQPRKIFKDDSLNELALSIKEHGILQPILVRSLEDGNFEIIAGERRFRAAGIVGLKTVPVIVKDMEDKNAIEASLIENLQREDLNPIEEAIAYKELIDKRGYTQEELSVRIGKSRSHIANTIRIMSLPNEIVEMVADGKLTAGHARAILSLKEKKHQIEMANRIIQNNLSVRASEAGAKKDKEEKDINIVDLEERLQEHLGTRVIVKRHKRGGRLEVTFVDDEDLERILELLGITQ